MKAVDLLLSPHGDSDPVQEAKRSHPPCPPHLQYILTGDPTPMSLQVFHSYSRCSWLPPAHARSHDSREASSQSPKLPWIL